MKHHLFVAIAAVGACLGILGAGAQTPAEETHAPGRALTMLGTAIPVLNLDRSLEFFTKGLGLQATPRRDVGEVVEEPLMFPGGGPYLILLWHKAPKATIASAPDTQRVILDVPDLKALASRLEANGYRLKGPISDNPQHHISVAHVDDPDGNHFELVQRAP